MKQIQKEIEGQLFGRLVANWCAQKAAGQRDFFHQYGYDSGSRVVRYMTERTRSLFLLSGETGGYWKNGSAVMYQIYNQPKHMELHCTASPIDLKNGKEHCSISLCRDVMQNCTERTGIRWRNGRLTVRQSMKLWMHLITFSRLMSCGLNRSLCSGRRSQTIPFAPFQTVSVC